MTTNLSVPACADATRAEMSTDENSPFRLDEHVGYLPRRARARADEAAGAVIPPPYHARDLAVLLMLETLGPRSQQELAELCRGQPHDHGQAD